MGGVIVLLMLEYKLRNKETESLRSETVMRSMEYRLLGKNCTYVQ